MIIDNKLSIERIRELFSLREFEKINALLEQHNVTPTILEEDDAELMSIFAFSLYNTNNFTRVIPFSKEVMRYIEGRKEEKIAHDLFESILAITTDSYKRTGKLWNGYLMLRKKIHLVAGNKDRLVAEYNHMKIDITQSIIRFLYWFFPILSFATIFSRRIFSWRRDLYVSTIAILLILVLLLIFKRGVVERILLKFL